MAQHPGETTEALRSLALYNYGHYTSMLVRDGKVRGLDLHLGRLVADSTELFGKPLDPADVIRDVRSFLRSEPADVVVRVTVYAADFSMQHPIDANDVRILVTGRPAPSSLPQPVSLATVPFVRELPRAKHVGLFGQLWGRRTAQLAGRDDALLTTPDGLILEGATWNIGFITSDGYVVWPDSEALPGVTLALVRAEYERRHPDRSSMSPVTTSEIGRFAAAFTMNAVSGVRAVNLIDEEQLVEDHPTIGLLIDCYADIEPEQI